MILDGAEVIFISKKDNFGIITYTDYDVKPIPVKYLAICQYDSDKQFYVFLCNDKLEVEQDSTFETMEKAKQYAYEKNKHVEWENICNLVFTYLFERSTCESREVSSIQHPEHFGSWIISKGKKQIVFDGKDQWYILQVKSFLDSWKDDTIIKSDDISPEKIEFMYSWLMGG